MVLPSHHCHVCHRHRCVRCLTLAAYSTPVPTECNVLSFRNWLWEASSNSLKLPGPQLSLSVHQMDSKKQGLLDGKQWAEWDRCHEAIGSICPNEQQQAESILEKCLGILSQQVKGGLPLLPHPFSPCSLLTHHLFLGPCPSLPHAE